MAKTLDPLLEQALFDKTREVVDRVALFWELLVRENEIQNLTRLTSPQDFVEGHLQDVLELQSSGFLKGQLVDLGSGGGVPGLLSACIESLPWILCESERSKADFLSRTARTLKLSSVEVYSGRIESLLEIRKVETVVARAVGPVTRIFRWIEKCSTWNKLVLLKGPAWEQEWNDFQKTSLRGRLNIENIRSYSVGKDQRKRVIIQLNR